MLIWQQSSKCVEPYLYNNTFSLPLILKSKCFCPKRLTVSRTCIHVLIVVAATQGADQHIRNSSGFSILPKDTLTYRSGTSNQQPSNNKTLALPLSHSCWFKEKVQLKCSSCSVYSLNTVIIFFPVEFSKSHVKHGKGIALQNCLLNLTTQRHTRRTQWDSLMSRNDFPSYCQCESTCPLHIS